MNAQIEQLARQHSFAALSAADQELVLATMSREEFDALREILRLAPALDAGPEPAPQIRAKLLTRLATRPVPSTRFLQKTIPLWQAAALMLTVFLTGWWLKKEQVQVINVPMVQLKTDTIYQDKIVWRDRVRLREKIIYREKPTAEPVVLQPETPENQFIASPWPKELATTGAPQAPAGTSLADEPELLDFFTNIK